MMSKDATPVAESAEVTQADREAARFAVECVTDTSTKARPGFADLWEDDLTRAFARHRLASYEAGHAEGVREAAEAAEGFNDPNRDWLRRSVWDEIKRDTAQRIRALSKEPTK